MSFRILFLGENWYGSCARACCYALRRLGCNVHDIDIQTILPQVRRPSSRLVRRLLQKTLIREYNDWIIDLADSFRPDILLAFKGQFVELETLSALRARGTALYNYYPDRVAVASGVESLAEYDCVFDTKRFWDGDMGRRVKLNDRIFLPHGYDPDIHRPLELEERDIGYYGCDVGFIANYSSLKEVTLKELIEAKPDINLQIWGSGWIERCRSRQLKKFVRGGNLYGEEYARAIRATKINLGIMGITAEAKDETSTRSFEIPACGGFMLHERNAEILSLYGEEKEVACFGSTRELVEKIDYYLAHPDRRESVARAGYARCVPAYSYDNRMAELLRWHRECWPLLKAKRAPSKKICAE